MSVRRRASTVSKNDKLEGLVVANRYKLGPIFDSGSFGEIRKGVDIKTKESVAIKLEKITLQNKEGVAPLQEEYNCYKMLGSKEDGCPKVFFYGMITDYNAMVMQCLGKNLEQVFNRCGRQFSLKTIIYIALQLLQRIETVHNSYLLFRDIKPENFCLGKVGTPQENIIYIIDFGLAKKYWNSKDKKHIPLLINRKLTGTARYMSINANLGREHSRRDDLESIGYMIIYFLRQGKLPWSGLKANTPKERYDKIADCKRGTPVESLCFGFPDAFPDYIRMVRNLDFEDKPNYTRLRKLFVNLFEKEGFNDDGLYDWCC